jgi:hypothetical protein
MPIKLFRVRNAQGQNIGTWYAKNEKQALAKAQRDVNADKNAFRKSGGVISLADCTATEIQKRQEP